MVTETTSMLNKAINKILTLDKISTDTQDIVMDVYSELDVDLKSVDAKQVIRGTYDIPKYVTVLRRVQLRKSELRDELGCK